jgi:hydrogenase small subunit
MGPREDRPEWGRIFVRLGRSNVSLRKVQWLKEQRMSQGKVQELPVIWLQGTGYSGCSVSLLNAASPRIANVLLEEIAPGKHVSLRFHPTVMAASGEMALEILADTRKSTGYVLMVEGGIPEKIPHIGGSTAEGKEVSIVDTFVGLAKNAACILAVGTCASYGGIPAAKPNPSGSQPLSVILAKYKVNTPYLNIPGCPPHPDWILGTIAHVILKGLPTEADLADHARLKNFYGRVIHENCPRRADFDAGKFAHHHGDDGCLYELGCKGPLTYSDCPKRQWNSGINWPIGAGSPCLGCVEPGFPDLGEALYKKIDCAHLPRIEREAESGRLVFVSPRAAAVKE